MTNNLCRLAAFFALVASAPLLYQHRKTWILRSPKHSPPSVAILRPSLPLSRARDNYEKARSVSHELQKAFDDLSRKLEPDLDPDEERYEPDARSGLELASLGVELALKKKDELQLERQVIIEERYTNLIQPHIVAKRLRNTDHRYLSAGDYLWKQKLKKARFDDPGVVRLLDPRGGSISACLLALYKKCDGVSKTKKRPSSFRSDALRYYDGEVGGKCHVTGSWWDTDLVKATHIVSFFLDSDELGEILFGSRAPSLQRAGNALLSLGKIEKWFDSYHLLIVPVDATENPITRWKVDVISSDIRNTSYNGPKDLSGDLDGKELQFRNDKQPVSRFMYFHFIMALIRIKDVKCQGWQDVWARYYQQRPFLTPGNYMRQSMLLALATHFGTAEMRVVESWIVDHSFDSPLILNDDESAEAARRVHLAVDEAIARAERGPEDEDSESDEEDYENDDE
ncbi:hypothetical protein B0T26DRAFT_652111 [Lasiosphaeria miniovina]|uniref:HNH nuclease domain-containing protein n=1 Tax=Lasiosphaeria miniovina TaxID=1954250 RepID=A0AA40A5A9_9PEZI|nr:uncharacterized protein B0T26DRAFT_652111 [Lasiosphaeria miniovina]KAK0709455.1 hypothetical protein B0T26DRAFT_652111 [Lasiosphaeria miniovina]